MTELQIRRLTPSDSIEELTALLHRAYKRLADMGQRFVATYQSTEVTRRRADEGECFVAVLEGKIVGTIVLRMPDVTSGCDWYDRADVASFGQFGVEPSLQGTGIGRRLLEACESRAREAGA